MTYITSNNINTLVRTSYDEGGYTLNLSPNQGRYVVGDGPLGMKFTSPTADELLAHANDVDGNTQHLTHVARYWAAMGYDTVGGWVDLGTLYLDPGTRVDELGEAVKLGKQRGELAIWDSVDCEVITL